MEALAAALQMGNRQSLIQLWDNIEVSIAANDPDDVPFLPSVRALHELVSLENSQDPNCQCPRLNGGCE
jgi:hypothetical protein